MNKKKSLQRLSKKIALSLLLGTFTALAFAPNVYALPQAGTYSNSASIVTTGATMDISSGKTNNVLNWQAFSIGSDETVNFKGPDKNYLNLVNGITKSKIYGALNGGTNTNIYLVNPNGIIFGKTAKVNVSNLVASTRAIASVNTTDFEKDGTNPLATSINSAIGDITNLGDIQAKSVVLEGNNIIIQDAARVTTDGTTKLKDVTIKASGDATVGHKVDTTTTLTLNVDSSGDGIYTSTNYDVSDYASAKAKDFVAKGGSISQVATTEDGKYASGYTLQDLSGTTRSEDDSTLNVREGIIEAMLVDDVYDLQNINNSGGNGTLNPSGDYLLAGDIDASATANWEGNFSPLGGNSDTSNNTIASFTGTFNGADNTIKGLVIKDESKTIVDTKGKALQSEINTGLFGYATNSTIKNVRLEDCAIEGTGYGNIATIVGKLEGGTIENVYSTGLVTVEVTGSGQFTSIGGLVGYLDESSLSNSYNETTINVSDSHLKDSDTNYNYISAGGIVGEIWNGSVVKNVYNTGTIAGSTSDPNTPLSNYDLSGIAGYVVDGSIENTYNSASIAGEGFTIAGVRVNQKAEYSSVIDSSEITSKNNYYATTDSSGNLINQNTYDSKIASITGLTYDEMLDSSNYTFEDSSGDNSIDAIGGKHKIWRTYEGKTMPLLTYFLETVAIKDSRTTYNGLEQTATIESAIKGEEIDSSKLIDITGTDAGSYLIYSGQYGYDFVSEDETSSPVFTIDEKELIAHVYDASMTYGNTKLYGVSFEYSPSSDEDSLNKNNYYLSGFVNGEAKKVKTLALDDGESSLNFGYMISNNGVKDGKSKDVGTYSDAISMSSFNENLKNYKISDTENTSGTLTINPKEITLTAYKATKTYDGLEGLREGQTILGTNTSVLVNGDASGANISYELVDHSAKNAGSYDVKGTITGVDNLSINYIVNDVTAGAYKIKPKELTAHMYDASMTYGSIEYPSFTKSKLSGDSLDQGDYYLSGFVKDEAKDESSLILDKGEKLLLGYEYICEGVVSTTDGPKIISKTKDVGTYTGDASGSLSITSENLKNYTINNSGNTCGNLTINKANLELKANDVTSVYGSAESSITYGYTTTEGKGFVNGDDGDALISSLGDISYTNSGYKDPNHTKDVNDDYKVSLRLGYTEPTVQSKMAEAKMAPSSSLANYNVSLLDGTSSITKKEITLLANDAERTYDGLTGLGDGQVLTGTNTSVLVNGDETTASISYELADEASNVKNAGSYDVKGVITGVDNLSTNYNVTDVTTDAYKINQKELVAHMYDASMTYGNTKINGVSFEYSPSSDEDSLNKNNYYLSGFVNGEAKKLKTLALDDGESSLNFGYMISNKGVVDGKSKNVGTYSNAISMSSFSENLKNYKMSKNGNTSGTLTIKPADLTFKANYSGSVTYGDKDNTLTDDSKYSYTTIGTGFVNGDDEASLTSGKITYANSAFDAETKDTINAGESYHASINKTDALTNALSNYNVNLINSTDKLVLKKDITLVANNASRTYDGTTGLGDGQVLTGTDTSVLVNGDESNANISYELVDVLTPVKNARRYAVKGVITGVDNLNTNYNVDDVSPGAYTISKALVELKANNVSSVYGSAESDITYGYTTTEGKGFANGDDGDAIISDAGYELTYTNSGYKDSNHTNDVSDNYKVSLRLGYSESNVNYGKPAKNYILENYDVSFADGASSITKKEITLTADEASKTYDGLEGLSEGQVLTGTDTSVLVNGDETNASISYELADSSVKNTGNYDVKGVITGVDNLSTNYNVTDVTAGAYKINKADLELKANDVSSVYGSAESDITYGYTTTEGKGFANGDDVDALLSDAGIEFNYTNSGYIDSTHTKDVGDKYVVTMSGEYTDNLDNDSDENIAKVAAAPSSPSLENYNVNLVDGKSSITKASLELTANYSPDSITYGDVDSADNYSYSAASLVNGDTATSLGLDKKVLYTNEGYKDDGYTKNVADDYEVSVSTASQNTINNDLTNYDITYKSDTFNIAPKYLSIEVDYATMTYGNVSDITWESDIKSTGSDHFELSGFVNGETSLADALENDADGSLNIELDTSDALDEEDSSKTKNASWWSSYDITGSVEDNLTNYKITDSVVNEAGKNKINIKKALLELKANDVSSVYGSSESDITYGYTTTEGKGFVNGDDGAALINEAGGISYKNSAYKDNGYTNDVSDDYKVSMGINYIEPNYYRLARRAYSPFTNYNVRLVDGVSSITKKDLTLTANSLSRIYDGSTGLSEGQVLTGTDTSVLVNGDETNASISYELADASAKNAGSYDVKGVITGVDNLSTNYDVTDVTAGAYTINKALLSIIMNDVSLTYGDATEKWAELTTSDGEYVGFSDNSNKYKVKGFINSKEAESLINGVQVNNITDTALNETLDDARVTKDVGDYALNGSFALTDEVNENYELTSVKSGVSKVNPANLTITPNDVLVSYGDESNSIDYTSKVVGLTNGDTESNLIDGKLKYSNTAFKNGETKDVGTSYLVSILNGSELDSSLSNYQISYGTSMGVIENSNYKRIDDIIDGTDKDYNQIVDFLLAPEANEIHNRRIVKSDVASQDFFEVQVDTTKTVQTIINSDGSVYTMDNYAGLLKD